MRTVVITGARQWADLGPIRAALRGADMLIVGDCPPDPRTRSSADSLALWVAVKWDILVQVYAASAPRADFLRSKGVQVELVSDWARDGKRAGPLRNGAIAAAAKAANAVGEVCCYAFPLPGSVGTYDCAMQLRASGLHVDVQAAPQRMVTAARDFGYDRER